MTTSVVSRVTPLSSRNLADINAVLGKNPVVNCFVASRVAARMEFGWNLPGQLLGFFESDHLDSVVFAGANVVPAETTANSREAFAHRLLSLGRRCTSMVGEQDQVMPLWQLLEHAWPKPREIRFDQPVFAIACEAPIAPDPRLRTVAADEVDALLPACVAMFTEEVGISPLREGEGDAYRERVRELVNQGRAFAIFEDGEVIFKAEVGAIGGGVCQVQGVWVRPDKRGQGMATPALAGVLNQARSQFAPIASLYGNSYNERALRVYRRLQMKQVAVFSTVLW
jgi:predicted GNAT family acetyltransferase